MAKLTGVNLAQRNIVNAGYPRSSESAAFWYLPQNGRMPESKMKLWLIANVWCEATDAVIVRHTLKR